MELSEFVRDRYLDGADCDTVVVVGAGPIGLAAIATAQLYSPSRITAVDLAASRLAAARDLGADATVSAQEEPEQLVGDLTDGLGADVVIEAVGVPEAFEMCTRMVRPGGRVANMWIKDVTITTGLVDTTRLPCCCA